MEKNLYIIIKETNYYNEYILDKELYLSEELKKVKEKESTKKIFFKNSEVIYHNGSENIKLEENKPYKEGNREILLFINNEKYFSRKEKNYITVGNNNSTDIFIENTKGSIEIIIENNHLYNKNKLEIYLNGVVSISDSVNLEIGDLVFLENIKFYFYSDYITIIGAENSYKCKLDELFLKKKSFEGFPIYKRSPRLIKKFPDETIEILMPPSKSKNKKGHLAKILIPPIVMTSLTLLISFINPRGIYILVSIVGTVMSTVFSVTSYVNEKKESNSRNALRDSIYTKYLLKTRKKLNNLKKEQIEALLYHNPNCKEVYKLIDAYNSRIYERNNTDYDFINIEIGKSSIAPSYKMKIQENELDLEKDELVKEAREVYSQFKNIENMPITVDLKSTHLGIVGEKKLIHEQLNTMFTQLTFGQSYHDIEIIFLYDEKYRKNFEWLKWYPHFKVKSINVTGIIDSERVRDQALGSLSQILKDRKLKQDEKKKDEKFLPHFIFVIDEPKLIINHSIMEYLQKEKDDLGFTIIYTTHLKSNLPENIKTIVTLDNWDNGTILLSQGIMVNKKIELNHIGDIDLENMSRKLSCLEHVQGLSSQIPKSITFFEMYNIETPEELNIANRWEINSSHKSLAVPLGVRGEDDYVYLNLHEKAHGPHGLVAGTTGSGKSEIVQSYILSLAANFHPYEVGFLLIDYKGGGMASLFKNLPHLLGTITNLDGAESMRAMASIKSELARRQVVFSKYNVNHINQYNKLFKNGEVDDPIPHLFLISDEFAELKKEQPDFMSELVSAARIGRSLGIHLILATQKPTGVVDDQIWSNSKFKLALKVQNESDSNEILKTPDAASITLPGRSYLQVGNNEIYELFQSAWSGASYIKEKEGATADNRVYLINDLGQRELLNEDLSVEKEETGLVESELDVVVNHIQDVFKGMKLKEVEKPWLPSLEDNLVTPYININKAYDVNLVKKLSVSATIGIVDIPENQKQVEYTVDFTKEGNLAIFSSSGFGKSTTLTTIALSMAIKNSPSLLQYYILDLGNSSLIQLKDLPHTADYLAFDDVEKLTKLIKILESELKNRKRLLGQKSALNFNMYNEISENKLPAIIIYIDNYDVIKELGYEIEEFITKLSRDGVGLGIYIIITASRPNNVKYAVLNNFKNKFAHYMFDATDITSVVGRSSYPLKEIQGRALIKLDNINIMQVYKSVKSESDMEYTKNIGLIVGKINEKYTGPKILGVPVLPEILTPNMFESYSTTKTIEKDCIPIGLDIENITIQYIDLNLGNQLIVGPSQCGKTSILKYILNSIKDSSEKIYLFDSADLEFYKYKEKHENLKYIDIIEDASEMLKELKDIIKCRRDEFEEFRTSNDGMLPKQFFATLGPIYMLVDDCDKFAEVIKNTKNLEADKIIIDALSIGLKIIGTSNSTKLKGFDGISKLLKEINSGLILGHPNEQTILSSPHMRIKKVELGYGFLYKKGDLVHIKTPIISE